MYCIINGRLMDITVRVTDLFRLKRRCNGRETDETFFQRKGDGHLPNTRNRNLLPHIFIVLVIENTCLYPAKRSFRVEYCFQPVSHSIIPWFCQWVIPSTFKVFFYNLSNVCPILFKFSPHHNHQALHVW